MDIHSIAVTSEGAEFLTLEEVKRNLRIDHSDDDLELLSHIASARKWAEHRTNRFFTPTNVTLSRNGLADEMGLAHKPVKEIVSIEYDDVDSTGNVLSSSAYELDAYNNCVRRAYGQTYPSTRYHWNSVRITYRIGYYTTGSPEVVDVPEDVKAACMLVVGDLYTNKEQQQDMELYFNSAADMHIGHYRVYE